MNRWFFCQYLVLVAVCLLGWGATTAANENATPCLLCPSPPVADFSAKWIWLPQAANYEWRNSYAYFRQTFSAGGKAQLRIAADTWYYLYLDGKLIERGTAPAEVNYKIFDAHELTLEPGEHVLAVLVHHIGQTCATAMRSRPGLLAELILDTGQKIVSDSTWKCLPAVAFQQYLPCMMSHFGFYEVCDGEKVPAGWTAPGFNDKAWYAAQVLGPVGCPPWSRLIARDIPLLSTSVIPVQTIVGRGQYQPGPIAESVQELTVAVEMANRLRQQQPRAPLSWPLALGQGEASEYAVLDFGREVTGHIRLGFKPGKAGQKIDIGYDETCDRNGLPNPRRTYVHFADRYFLAPGQVELSVLGGRGFRYLLVDVATGKGGVILTSAEIDERTYPITVQSRFHCSDPALDRLFDIGLETTRLCMLDTYVDCPSRERVMWMDMYPEAHCSSYGFGITQLWRRCLYLFAQNTSQDGLLTGAVRSFAPIDYDPMLVSYTMYYVISTVDYVQHSGDLAAGQALLPTLLKQFEVISHYLTPDGLINEKFPGWGTFLDWSAMDFGGVSAGNNGIYILMHRKTAWLARQLQQNNLARDLDQRADQLTKRFQKSFWNEKERLYIDAINNGQPSPVRSQWVNTMAVLAGVVKGEAARALLKRIIDKKALLPRTSGDFRLKPDFKMQTGGIVPIGTPGSGFLLAQALFSVGLDQEAIDYYKNNWSAIAPNATFMEHFIEDPNTSFCHGWGAGPVVSFPQYILGVAPLTPGWETITIQPHGGNLTWAEGSVVTPRGLIQVSWKKINGKLSVSFKIPESIRVVNP